MNYESHKTASAQVKLTMPDENRFITLRVSTSGMRIIDKKGISKVVNDLKLKGIKV